MYHALMPLVLLPAKFRLGLTSSAVLLPVRRHRTHRASLSTLYLRRFARVSANTSSGEYDSLGSSDSVSNASPQPSPDQPSSSTASCQDDETLDGCVTDLERFLDGSHDSGRLNNSIEETLPAEVSQSPTAALAGVFKSALDSLRGSTDEAPLPPPEGAGAADSTGDQAFGLKPVSSQVDELDRFLNSDISDSGRANNHPEELLEDPSASTEGPLTSILTSAVEALLSSSTTESTLASTSPSTPPSSLADVSAAVPMSSTLVSSAQTTPGPAVPLAFLPDVLTPASPRQGRSVVNTWSEWWGRLMYSYYNWRQDVTSDLQTLSLGFVTLVFFAGVIKNAIVDKEPSVGIVGVLEDMYQVVVLSFGQDLPDATAGPNAQIFSVVVAAVGLAAFALVLALVEQVVLEVIEANVRQGGSVYEQDHVLIVGWCTSQRDLELVQKSLQQVCFAFRNDGGTTIVVLTKRAKLDMEAYFRREIPDSKRYGSRLVFRQGSPLYPRDLMTVAAHKAAGIIIVSDQSRSPVEADAQSLRCAILFDELGELVRNQMVGPAPHVVIDMRTTDVVPLLGYSCLNPVIPISTAKRSARRIANMVKHPYISIVTQQLLNFDNSSNLFVHSFPSLAGLQFKELAYRFPTATILGVVQHTGVAIHKPYGEYVVQPGDEIMMIRPTSIKYEDFSPLDVGIPNPAQTWERKARVVKPLRALPPLRLLDTDILSSSTTGSTTGIASYDGSADNGPSSSENGRKGAQAAATISYGRSRSIKQQQADMANGKSSDRTPAPRLKASKAKPPLSNNGSGPSNRASSSSSQESLMGTSDGGSGGSVRRNPAKQLMNLLMNQHSTSQQSFDIDSVNILQATNELANVIPVEYLETDHSPLNLLVCGWSDQSFMRHLICELDHGHFALPAGSNIVFCNQHSRSDSLSAATRVIQETLTNCSLSHVRMDPLMKYDTNHFDITQFKAAIVLCDVLWIDPDMNANNGVDELEEIDVLRLDALVMLAQLNIRKVLEEMNRPTINIICQKVGNEGMTRFEDRRRLPLGISVNFTSYAAKMLTQVLYSPKVLAAMSYGEVADIRIQDVAELADEGELVSWWSLVARSQMRNEVLLGYYRVPSDLASPLETVINPVRDRDKPRLWNNGDKCLKFLVLCDNFDGTAVSMRSVDQSTKQATWVSLRTRSTTDSESSMGSGSHYSSVDGNNGASASTAGSDRLRGNNVSR